MRITSAEETIQAKEAYECLTATHGVRFCAYRTYNVRFTETTFKEAVQIYIHHISYCGVGSHHQNSIVDCRIKELPLGSQTPLLHSTILWP